MTIREAYRLGYEFGLTKPGIKLKELPLPAGIEPNTPQAITFRLGYRDKVRGRLTLVKPWN